MTEDLVAELRGVANYPFKAPLGDADARRICGAAADEIERLTAENARIARSAMEQSAELADVGYERDRLLRAILKPNTESSGGGKANTPDGAASASSRGKAGASHAVSLSREPATRLEVQEWVSDSKYYQVRRSSKKPEWWTIVFTVLEGEAPEEIELGVSWKGKLGKELAHDVCDLMNEAYDQGACNYACQMDDMADKSDLADK